MEGRIDLADQTDDAYYAYALGEWDWWVTNEGRRLHAAEVTYDPLYQVAGVGRTACGKEGRLAIPGIFTRMAAERCKRCCDRLGYPRGIGSPKNDQRCRPLVEARLVARRDVTLPP